MEYTYEFVKCNYCGKEFLVERTLMGTDHTIGVIVSCKECVKKAIENQHMNTVNFKKQHPEEYKVIQEWAGK